MESTQIVVATRYHNCVCPSGRPGSSDRGFALLLVLMILVILTTMTASLAYSVSAQSLLVDSRIAVTQNRYAMDAALSVIRQRWENGDLQIMLQEHGYVRDYLTLSDSVVQYRIWDEATKLKYMPGSTKSLPDLLNEATMHSLDMSSNESSHDGLLLFEDVFELKLDELPLFYGKMSEEHSAIDVLTLWGDGRVNIHTASEKTIQLLFQNQGDTLIQSVLQLKRYRRIQDIDRLVSLLGLSPRDSKIVSARITTNTTTLTVRLACFGPTLRTDGFAVIDLLSDRPQVVLWRDLPPGKNRVVIEEDSA